MRTQAALFAIAAMCVGRLPAQDSVVAAHDSTIAAHDTSCTYELCRLELQKGTKAWELFASAHRTPVPLDTLLTSVSPSVKANYVSYKRDAKAGTWLVILGSATEVVQYNMWETSSPPATNERSSRSSRSSWFRCHSGALGGRK